MANVVEVIEEGLKHPMMLTPTIAFVPLDGRLHQALLKLKQHVGLMLVERVEHERLREAVDKEPR